MSSDVIYLRQGQGLSVHTALFDAMMCVCWMERAADVALDGNPVIVRQGEMLVIPGNVPHAQKAIERFKMMLTLIKS